MTIIQKYVQYNETFKKPEHGSILVNWHQELKYVHEIYGSPGGALFHLLALDYEQVHAVFQQLIKVASSSSSAIDFLTLCHRLKVCL